MKSEQVQEAEKNTQDISLIVIKPEIIEDKQDVLDALCSKGYVIVNTRQLRGWRGFIPQIYVEFTKDQNDFFARAYDIKGLGDEFFAVVVSHKDGNTIDRLVKDIGNFAAYQKREDESLRGRFGLPEEDNIGSSVLTVVFNGLHKANDAEDLYKHLTLFGFVQQESPP
ncbi:hypothetical protein KY310_04975 [Candidatus Woesearchaeota archaeon]|nr:hypothetical protein [Candidatus Woesearchaeota archaeon]